MKKLLTTLFLVVAIASFGGILNSAHAATLTPAQAAAAQQSLETMKAELLQLQAQAAAQAGTSAPVTASPAAPSAIDLATLSQGLTLLASALSNLQTEFAQNPQLAAGHEAAVLATLKGIGTTLAMIGTSVTGRAMSAPVAAAPSSQTPAAPAPIAQSAPATPSTVQPLISAPGSQSAVTPGAPTTAPSVTAPAGASANTVPATAQASSSWSWKNLNWPLVIVIVLVVLAVGLWLFWPSDEDDRGNKKAKKNAMPSSPVKPVTMNQPMASANFGKPAMPQQTPLTSAMASHAESNGSQQQRKPA